MKIFWYNYALLCSKKINIIFMLNYYEEIEKEIEDYYNGYMPEEYGIFMFNSLHKMLKLSGNQIKILICCWKLCSYNPINPDLNRINTNRLFKESVREMLKNNISDYSINDAVYSLAKEGFIVKECRGQYYINPIYFFKGTFDNRENVLDHYNLR